jgi:hypothetical protein
MDPRDPRSAGDDGAPLPPPPVPPPPRSEEELNAAYGPAAPEPEWRKLEEENERFKLKLEKRHHFNRERFLLRCIAWIIGVQFGIYILGAIACVRISEGRLKFLQELRGSPANLSPTVCPVLADKIQDSANQGLAVLLALLGGGALAADELRRSRGTGQGGEDPRRPDGDAPP